MFKRFFEHLSRPQVHAQWENVYHSHMRNMSCGSQQILKVITMAHGENWRRGREKRKHSKG